MPPRLFPLFDRVFTVLARSRWLVSAALFTRWASTELLGHRVTRGGLDHERNGEAWFLRQMAPHCATFIDVGANVGAWTRLMLAAAPHSRAVLYEPATLAVERLRTSMEADQRVEIVNAAVADQAGILQFYEEPDAGESSSLLAGHSLTVAATREVRVVTIDGELERLGIDHVDLLKIDAEGFDLHVLRGARASLAAGRIDAVQFEYNRPWAGAGATLAAARSLLESCGMELYVLREGELRTINTGRLGELFTYANCAGLSSSVRARLASSIGGDALD